MLVILIYISVVFIATTIGAISGIGGGIIIKPVFDAIGIHSSSEISFFSTCCVFTMSVVSIKKQLQYGESSIDLKKVILLSIGSVIGGICGEFIFLNVIKLTGNHINLVKLYQSAALFIIILFILIYTLNKNKFRTYNLNSILSYCCAGCFLGTISTFLGIGGGPLNIMLITLLFSINIKTAVVYSIITIFFSQLSRLTTMIINETFFTYDIKTMIFLLPSAMAGGYLGSLFNKKMLEKQIYKTYLYLLFILLTICVYNIFKNI